jgi:signal transduction histidine kinase
VRQGLEVTLTTGACAPAELVAEAVEIVGQSTDRCPIEEHVALELPDIRGDRDKIVEVLVNLLTNAERHSPLGAPIEVRVRADDGAIEFTVADHGPGIPSELRGRLFQPFATLDRGELGTAHGTGLGLYLSRVFVEAHGGRIWIGDEAEQGAVVHFTLPAC